MTKAKDSLKKPLKKVKEVVPQQSAPSLEAKKDKYIKERDQLLKKHGLTKNIDILFPMYNTYPDDLQLALNVINKHKPLFIEILNDRRGK